MMKDADTLLKDARFVIQKLAGWQGIDLSELDEEYDGLISSIDGYLEGNDE